MARVAKLFGVVVVLSIFALSNLMLMLVGTLTTCTGGEADLEAGALFVAISILGAAVLFVTRSSWTWLAMLIASIPLLLFGLTMLNIAVGWFGRGMTACQTKLGSAYPPDGGEPLTPFMIVGVAVIFALGVVARRPRRS